MIFARTDHQIGTGLCELHYFNAIAPEVARGVVGGGGEAWTPVNSSSRESENSTGRLRTRSSRLYASCVGDILRLGSVIIDGYDVATANDEIDRAACLYSDIVGYQCVINTPTHTWVSKQPIEWLFRR